MRKQFVYLISVFLLSACTSATLLSPQTKYPTTTAPSPTVVVTHLANTNVPAKTTTPISTPTETLPEVIMQCVNTDQEQVSEMGIDPSYRIVMIGYNELDYSKRKGSAPDSYLFDPNTGEKIILRKKEMNTWLDLYSASPNGRWFEYFANTPAYRKMFLLEADGTKTQTELSQKTGEYFYEPIGWTNDHQVLFQKNLGGPKKGLLIYNLITNKQEENAQDYPRANYDDIITFFSYNSAMDRVAYLDTNYSLVLYDLMEQREIKSVNKNTFEKMYPVWSNDGEHLAFVRMEKNENKQELYLINKQGELHRLTFFSDQYDEVHIYGVSWSPDNRYIAFVPQLVKYVGHSPSPDEKVEATLKIIDTKNGNMVDLCIYGDSEALYWSPDGKYLLTNQDTALIIDLERKNAVRFEDEMRVGGWLKVDNSTQVTTTTP